VDEWARFTVSIMAVFKKSRESRLRRGSAFLWVRMDDLICKCPKVKVNKYISIFASQFLLVRILLDFCFNFCRTYLLLGNEHKDGQPGLMAGRQSVVIEWRDDWQEKIKSLQRRSRVCEEDEEEEDEDEENEEEEEE